MSQLNQQNCVACQLGAPQVTGKAREALLQELAEWQIQQTEGIDQLRKVYRFGNFLEALAFTNRLGAMAEAQNHHPAILTEWGKVTVSWWTHKIKGLHQNDFICAAKTDACYQNTETEGLT